MGISIKAGPYEGSAAPATIILTLQCDSAEDMFCRGFTSYQHEDGFPGAHSAAMRDGWLERQSANGRLWLCPRCSGK